MHPKFADIPAVLKCPCCASPVSNEAVLDAAQVIHARIIMHQRAEQTPPKARKRKKAEK